MTATVDEQLIQDETTGSAEREPRHRPMPRHEARTRFPARPRLAEWPATRQIDAEQTGSLLTGPPFVLPDYRGQRFRRSGLSMLLEALGNQPGESWQQRWLASGAEEAGTDWKALLMPPREDGKQRCTWEAAALTSGLAAIICADLVRPALRWLLSKTTGQGVLASNMAMSRDPEGFARLRALCDADPSVSSMATSNTLYRSAVILAAKGGLLTDITVGDVLELLEVEAQLRTKPSQHAPAFYRTLHQLASFPAPHTLREMGPTGQLSPAELIDRYQIRCRPIRDLLVEYVQERQPALDYGSLKSLAYHLGGLFWADIERHHPGIDTLHLPVEVANAWKQRLRTKTKKVPPRSVARWRSLLNASTSVSR